MQIFIAIRIEQDDPPSIFIRTDKKKVLQWCLTSAQWDISEAFDKSSDYSTVLEGDTLTVTCDGKDIIYTIHQEEIDLATTNLN